MRISAMTVMLSCALALVATSASARPDGAAPKKEKKAPDPNKRVCRFAADTGSHIPQSTCRTQAQWDAIDRTNAAAADEVMRRRPAGQQ